MIAAYLFEFYIDFQKIDRQMPRESNSGGATMPRTAYSKKSKNWVFLTVVYTYHLAPTK